MVKSFLVLFEDFDEKKDPSFLLNEILSKTAYLSFLSQAYDGKEARTKIENVHEFIQAVCVFEQKQRGKGDSEGFDDVIQSGLLEKFLHEVALLQEKVDENRSGDFVQMMTLHAAKGLEFETIFMAGLEENLFPSARSLNAQEDLEEERRLMYVGMTRAKERLVLLNASSRVIFGQCSRQVPSRFLSEIKSELVQTVDLEETSTQELKNFFEESFLIDGVDVKARKEKSKKERGPRKQIQNQKKKPEALWPAKQPVMHEKFGVGVVLKAEKATGDDYHVTVLFKSGKKKILSSFLSSKTSRN
jgi:DNA helicase-2/ATP-dependent DNA helicase PcrA